MSTYPELIKIIKGSSLEKGEVYIQNIKFSHSNRTLIKGTVYDVKGIPLEGVGVEVVRIDNSSSIPSEIILGTVFSEKNGVYAFSVEIKENCEYLLNIYSGLPL